MKTTSLPSTIPALLRLIDRAEAKIMALERAAQFKKEAACRPHEYVDDGSTWGDANWSKCRKCGREYSR